MTEKPAERLGRLIRARRKELKLTQADVQQAHGPSPATLRLIEAGKHKDFRASTSQPLETVLKWEPGSIDRVLAGGAPIYKMVGVAEFKERMHTQRESMTSEQLAASDAIEAELLKSRRRNEASNVTSDSRTLSILRARRTPPDERTPEQWDLVRGADAERDRLAVLARRGAVEKPLIDIVWDGQQLAVEKGDADFLAYVRQVEAAVVGVIGVDRLADGLDGKAQEALMVETVRLGVDHTVWDAAEWAREHGVNWGDFNKRFIELLRRGKVSSVDGVTDAMADLVPPSQDTLDPAAGSGEFLREIKGGFREMAAQVEANPEQFGLAARIEPGYRKGQSEQGDAGDGDQDHGDHTE
ncbi:MAG: hypothetical protein WBB07_23920 [Mycobacterium sp.]